MTRLAMIVGRAGPRASEAARSRPATTPAVRVVALDRFRGAAILLMIVDHLVLVTAGPVEVRLSVGRLAMPMFFVLAGHLATSPRWRHLGVFGIGVVLPLFVPWVDSPNVLCIWSIGVVVLYAARLAGFPLWVLVAAALTWAANGYADSAGSYDDYSLWGLMALGAAMPAAAFGWAERLPAWFGVIGSAPLRWYVGHVLVLQLLVLLAIELR